MAKKRVKVKRVRKSRAKGGKRGNQGGFGGSRLQFLLSHLPKYLEHVPRRNYKPFWDFFFPLYWAAFPYWIPKDKEPIEVNLALTEEEISPEVVAQKTKIIDATTRMSINPYLFYSKFSY